MSFNQENYNSYKESQLEKQKIQSRIQNSDPILQSNKYYEQKEKKKPIETRNYFSYISQTSSSSNPSKKIKYQPDNLSSNLIDKNPLVPERPHKKVLQSEYEKEMSKVKPISKKIVYNGPDNNMNKIMSGAYSDIQPKIEKKSKYDGMPSAQTLKLNNKGLLSNQVGNNHYNYTLKKKGNVNTNDDHFKELYDKNTNVQPEKFHKKVNVENYKSDIGNVMAHENYPKGYFDGFTNKPNQNDFKNIVKNINDNRENYGKFSRINHYKNDSNL